MKAEGRSLVEVEVVCVLTAFSDGCIGLRPRNFVYKHFEKRRKFVWVPNVADDSEANSVIVLML